MATWDATSDRVVRAIAGAQEGDRVTRAVEEAQRRQEAEPQPRADRDYLVADAVRRYGLGEELAAQIKGDGPAEILREARGLALDRARLAAAAADAAARTAD